MKKIELNPTNLPGMEEAYEAPMIETVEVRVEKGFQESLESPEDDGSF